MSKLSPSTVPDRIERDEREVLLLRLHRVQGQLDRAAQARRRQDDERHQWAERLQALELEGEQSRAEVQRHAALAKRREAALLRLRDRMREQRVTSSRERSARALAGHLVVTSLALVAERQAAGARELEIELRDVRIGLQRIAACRVRVVDSGGRPALLVHDVGQRPHWLAGWRPTQGVPGESCMQVSVAGPAHGELEALDSGDWRAVHAVLDAIEHWLAAPQLGLSPSWAGVVARLRASLDELPPRLRCRGVTVRAAGDGRADIVSIEFGNASFGARWMKSLELGLQSRAGGFSLHLLPGEDGALALLGEAAGQAGWRFPVGDDLPVRDRIARWRALGDADRAFALAVLEALAAAAEAGALGPGVPASVPAWLSQWAARARAEAHGRRPRWLWRTARQLALWLDARLTA